MHLELCRELTLGLVSLEHILAVVGGTTDDAFKGPISKVATLVVTHVPSCSEAFTAALWTWEGSLFLVDSGVNLEVLLLTEGFTTTREWTLEWLCPIVDVHVSLEANFSCEGLTAARMPTGKKVMRSHSIWWSTKTFALGFLRHCI